MKPRALSPTFFGRWVARAACCAAVAGCGETPISPTPDAAVDARPGDQVPGTDIVVTDAPSDVGFDAPADASVDVAQDAGGAAAAIERLLDDPTGITSNRDEAPDPRAMALMARLPAAPSFSATPNPAGYLADPLESSALARPFFMGRPHVFSVQIDAIGGLSASPTRLAGSLASAHGIVLPRRVLELEAGDGFRGRSPGPAALSRVDFDLDLAREDFDGLEANVLLLDRADTTLTLTLGTQTVTVDTARPAGNPRVVALDDGSAVSVQVARNPQGHCLNTRGIVAVTTHAGARGVVGEFFGVLHRAGSHLGFVHGVFGSAPSSGTARVLFRAVDRSGRFLWGGRSDGGLSSTPRVGGITNAAGSVVGSFRVRTAEGDEGGSGASGTLPFSFEIHTECR